MAPVGPRSGLYPGLTQRDRQATLRENLGHLQVIRLLDGPRVGPIRSRLPPPPPPGLARAVLGADARARGHPATAAGLADRGVRRLSGPGLTPAARCCAATGRGGRWRRSPARGRW